MVNVIKRRLGFVEANSFVKSAVSLCVLETGYHNFMKQFAIRYMLLKFFTDYEDTEDFEKIYADIYDDENCAVLKALVDDNEQVRDLIAIINEDCDMYMAKKVRQTKLGDVLDNVLTTLENDEQTNMISQAIAVLTGGESDEQHE